MKRNAPFSTYTRTILMKKSHDDVHKSLLGLSAAGEYHFIANFVALADADRTTYEKAKP